MRKEEEEKGNQQTEGGREGGREGRLTSRCRANSSRLSEARSSWTSARRR
jgi:hypothetical protein